MDQIPGKHGPIPTFVAAPSSAEPRPAVLVVHDALGMTEDLRNQARWLAGAGYLAAAPDLLHWGGRARCLFKTMAELARGTEGRSFDDLSAVRGWLAEHSGCTGKVGIVGFCLGGGFALALAPKGEYAACAANYGAMNERAWPRLAQACPIVASFGADDPTLKGAAQRLEQALSQHGVPHDVKEYPGVGHGFMNLHDAKDSNWVFDFLAWVSRTRYDARATADARARIEAFFATHLG